MAESCKHSNAVGAEDADTGAHIAFCLDCKSITHACFKPLYDHVERDLEKVRSWGVYYSKADGKRASESVAIQREVESVLANLREAMLMSRIEKNDFLERVAKVFEGRGEGGIAAQVRDLKLEVALQAGSCDGKPQVS